MRRSSKPFWRLVIVAWTAAACGLDVVGLGGGDGLSPDAGGVPSTSVDAATSDVPDRADSTTTSVDAATSDAGAPDVLAGPLPPLNTCAEILARRPGSASDIYMVDPDGPDAGAAAFPVRCDMSTIGGGWTLVGRELANATQTLRYLGADSQNPRELADGTASGLLGKRFIGKYTEVWIDWGAGSFIRFTRPATHEMFDNAVNTAAAITNVKTSDPMLESWLSGGAKLCVASRDPSPRPGDTSWAIKPQNDNNVACGCSGPDWTGRGAFYSGVTNSTSCGDYGGGWAGVRDTAVQKGGVTPTSETRIWIK